MNCCAQNQLSKKEIREKLIRRQNKVSAIGRVVKKWTRLLIISLDSMYTIFGISISLFLIGAYCYPTTFHTIRGVGYIVQIHVVLASIILFGISSAVIGIVGILGTDRRNDLLMGVQITLLMVFVLVQTSIFFSFFKEWEGNMHIGISMAVHLYSPHDLDSTYMDKIQSLFHCCGARGPLDYNVANMNFPKTHVPVSCCNRENCTQHEGHKDHIIIEDAYETGCLSRLHSFFYIVLIAICTAFLAQELLILCFTILYCFLNYKFPDEEPAGLTAKRAAPKVDEPPPEFDDDLPLVKITGRDHKPGCKKLLSTGVIVS